MATSRARGTILLGRGVISAGWYSILTGVAMLVVAHLLFSVREDDRAAGAVAVVLLVTGAWQLQRGLRAELRRVGRADARRRD